MWIISINVPFGIFLTLIMVHKSRGKKNDRSTYKLVGDNGGGGFTLIGEVASQSPHLQEEYDVS